MIAIPTKISGCPMTVSYTHLGAEISGIDKEMDRARRAVVKELYPAPERSRTRQRSPSHDYSRDIEPPDLDFGLGL